MALQRVTLGMFGSAILPNVAGAPSYLLDALGVSAARAYSTRKLRTAYAGSSIRIRRSSDNAEQDIGFSGENLDTAAVTTFVGANSAFVAKMYDQSGNGDDLVQATAGQQPRIVNAGTLETRNSLPAPKFDGSNDVLAGASSLTVAEACAVLATTEAGPTWSNFFGAVNGTGSGDPVQAGIAGFLTEGTFHLDAIGNAAFQNGSVNNGSNAAVFGSVLQQVRLDGNGVTWTAPEIGDIRNQGLYWPGWISEAILFSSALSAGNRTALYTNQSAYWGTP